MRLIKPTGTKNNPCTSIDYRPTREEQPFLRTVIIHPTEAFIKPITLANWKNIFGKLLPKKILKI